MAGIVEPKACCTLYDESGLPAGPIELPIEPARWSSREPPPRLSTWPLL